MIVQENMKIRNRDFIKTYSDAGFYIERDGVEYAEAIDPAEFGRKYTETDHRIDANEEKIRELENAIEVTKNEEN